MDFTQTEAQGTVGKRVRVRDETLGRVRIPRGTEGEVRSAQLQCPEEEEDSKERVWVVCLAFALTRHHTVSVLLRDVGKEQYVSAFEEIFPECSPQPVPSPERLPPHPYAHPARRAPLTLVFSSGRGTK